MLNMIQKVAVTQTDQAWWSITLTQFLPSRVLQELACWIAFFSHQASVREAAGECLSSSASSGCFHLPSKLMKIFTPENQEDNFPPLTVFQRHLDCVKSFCVRWEQTECEDKTWGMSAHFTPEPRMTHRDTETSLFAYSGYNNISTVRCS